ncbi:diaminopimelate epimerase [candidate division KSB1 bacterium]
MKLEFDKYSAHGNDFIIIDNRDNIIHRDDPLIFSQLCARRTGIGADGIILVDTKSSDFRLRFFNADGHEASMCGNGSRAAVHFAMKKNMIGKTGCFTVGDVQHNAQISGDGSIGVEIHLKSENIEKHIFTVDEYTFEGFFCNTGVSHLIIFDEQFYWERPEDTAKMIRFSGKFAPTGVNVSFAAMKGESNIRIVTFEKGVEDFTLSCGTAAAAAALSAKHHFGLLYPAWIHSGGGKLKVFPGDDVKKIWISGTVEKVYSGSIDDFLF